MEKKPPVDERKDETRKLAFVVLYMSMFVLVIFGIGPMI
jgi:hypothetical protein